MPEVAGLGTSIVLIIAVVLWVAYLVPVWTRKREYLATERNAIRLQQTLRIMAESAESPEEVQLEADARTIAIQQKAVAKEARLAQAVEHAKAVARARELDEQIKAVEREVRQAVKSTTSRSQRLRRTRLACFALLLVGIGAVVAGAIVPALGLLVAVGSVVATLAIVGLVAVNASASRMRRTVSATAPSVRDLVEAREVAAQAVTQEIERAQHVQGRGHHLQTVALLASRSWTPQQVPEQRAKPAYRAEAGDDLLQRARKQLAEDRRAISGPLARVTRLEPSFDELVTGEQEQVPARALTEVERRMATTEEVAPVRRAERAPAPERAQEAPAARAAGASRFAAMGVIDDEVAGLDVSAAFARRVG